MAESGSSKYLAANVSQSSAWCSVCGFELHVSNHSGHMGSQGEERGPQGCTRVCCQSQPSLGSLIARRRYLPWERERLVIQETHPSAWALRVCGCRWGVPGWGGKLLCSWACSWSVRSKMCHRSRDHTAARRWQNPVLSAPFMSHREFWWSPGFNFLNCRTWFQMDVGVIKKKKKIYNSEVFLICNNQTWIQTPNK